MKMKLKQLRRFKRKGSIKQIRQHWFEGEAMAAVVTKQRSMMQLTSERMHLHQQGKQV